MLSIKIAFRKTYSVFSVISVVIVRDHQKPRNFHQAKPIVSQINILATDT
jgi:hypothetical protein